MLVFVDLEQQPFLTMLFDVFFHDIIGINQFLILSIVLGYFQMT